MEKAINLIKQFEGLRLEAYKCPAGRWTIGWGHTANVSPGDRITAVYADELLRLDVKALEARIVALADGAGVGLTGTQRAALISFAFNVGFGALSRSTLWRKIAANPSDPTIAAEFARWNRAGGRVMPGLVVRRAAEANVYFGGEQ